MEKRVLIYWTAFNLTLLCRLIHTYSEACDSADMEIRPSNVVHVGSVVTITCSQRSNGKQGVKITQSNEKRWENPRGNSITINDTSCTPGRRAYLCKNGADKLVCGHYIEFGFPPDPARIISCEQEGESGNISCSWVLGRQSGIPNNCTLHLQMSPYNITKSVSGSCQAGTNTLTLPVAAIPNGEYMAAVVTSNQLGTNTSQFYNFTSYDIVKPHPPTNVTINCHQTADECSVTVHPDREIQHTRLRYRAVDGGDWQEAENPINRSFTLYHLHPLTQYHFQAACKYRYDRGIWSNWSRLVTWETPESRPRGNLDVWYKLSNTIDKTRTVTLYWKNASEVRGHIRFYQVTFRLVNQSSPVSVHNTTDTCFSKVIEAGDYVIAVSAHNSKGNSTPTLSRVTRQDVSAQGLLPPMNVIATTNGSSSVTLTWDLPAENEDLGWDQIVEWETPTEDKLSPTNWVKVPKFQRTVTISGHYKPYVCYQFRVYFLQEGRAGVPGMTMASTQEKAPEAALAFKVNVKKDGPVLVTWRGIPPHKQMGCILRYSIYLKDRTSGLTKEVKILYDPSQIYYQYDIDTGSMNGQYVLWMTYSNGAGETTTRQEVYFTVDGQKDNYRIVYMILAILTAALFLFSIYTAKQRLLILLSKILPNMCIKVVPDPANCEWAKEYISDKGKLRSFPSHASSTSDCDEAETLEIEVLSSEDESHYCPTYTINPLETGIHQEKDVRFQEDTEDLQPHVQQAEQNLYRSINFQPAGGMKVKTSDYLVNHVITMDYLPKNILTVYEDKSKEDLFHPQFLLPSWVMTSGTIALDTVRIDLS